MSITVSSANGCTGREIEYREDSFQQYAVNYQYKVHDNGLEGLLSQHTNGTKGICAAQG